MSLQLEIVTPERIVYSDEVESVVVCTTSGDVGLLPGHIPLISSVKPGELEVTKDGVKDYLAVDKGFVEVIGDQVRILTEAAIDIDEIDINSVLEAKQRAEEALREAAENQLDPAEIEKLESIARFALAQELAKAKRR